MIICFYEWKIASELKLLNLFYYNVNVLKVVLMNLTEFNCHWLSYIRNYSVQAEFFLFFGCCEHWNKYNLLSI